MALSEEQLATWAAVCEVRTPGAWNSVDTGMVDMVSEEPVCAIETDDGERVADEISAGDADFIVLAAEALPVLVARRARAGGRERGAAHGARVVPDARRAAAARERGADRQPRRAHPRDRERRGHQAGGRLMRPRPKPEAEASPAPKRKPRVRRTVFHGERPTPDAVVRRARRAARGRRRRPGRARARPRPARARRARGRRLRRRRRREQRASRPRSGRPSTSRSTTAPKAIAMHKANHPHTRTSCENIWEVDPREACGGRPVGSPGFRPTARTSRAPRAPSRGARRSAGSRGS
jgi:hypothetical protein